MDNENQDCNNLANEAEENRLSCEVGKEFRIGETSLYFGQLVCCLSDSILAFDEVGCGLATKEPTVSPSQEPTTSTPTTSPTQPPIESPTQFQDDSCDTSGEKMIVLGIFGICTTTVSVGVATVLLFQIQNRLRVLQGAGTVV